MNVRRIKRDMNIANDKVRLFNSREMLFNLPITEYSQLLNYEKQFEPYYDLWYVMRH